MKIHDELHDKTHMLGAVLNPFHVSPDAPVHGFKDIKIVNKRNDLTGYDVKPKMMLVNLSEMSSHDELNDHGMLGATESLINLSEMSSHDELHDHHMLGAMAPELMNLVSEMKMHDELHEKPHMLGAVLNPFHVSNDAPVHGFKDIKVVNKRNDLTGYDVKPKMIMLL